MFYIPLFPGARTGLAPGSRLFRNGECKRSHFQRPENFSGCGEWKRSSFSDWNTFPAWAREEPATAKTSCCNIMMQGRHQWKGQQQQEHLQQHGCRKYGHRKRARAWTQVMYSRAKNRKTPATCNIMHCKKSLVVFPSPARVSLTKLSLAGNYLIIPGRGEFGKWPPGWGRENR